MNREENDIPSTLDRRAMVPERLSGRHHLLGVTERTSIIRTMMALDRLENAAHLVDVDHRAV